MRLRKRKQTLVPERADRFRDDARVYALRGDNMWGHSITWSAKPGERGHDMNHGVIVGWLTHKPRPGDTLAVAMQSGRWGKWLIETVEHAQGVHDMFHAEVSGAYDYLDDDNVPSTAYGGKGLTGIAADLV